MRSLDGGLRRTRQDLSDAMYDASVDGHWTQAGVGEDVRTVVRQTRKRRRRYAIIGDAAQLPIVVSFVFSRTISGMGCIRPFSALVAPPNFDGLCRSVHTE